MRTESARILTVTVSIALLSLPTAAMSQDFELPARKSGHWEMKMVAETPGMPGMTLEACVDEASDAKMMAAGLSMSKEMCPQQEMKREGDAYVIDSTCKMGPMDTQSHVVITGDFQSAYTVDITVETTGGVAAMAGTNMIKQEARWIGADCGGLAPGEIMMPGGMKMNVDDMMKSMGGG